MIDRQIQKKIIIESNEQRKIKCLMKKNIVLKFFKNKFIGKKGQYEGFQPLYALQAYYR